MMDIIYASMGLILILLLAVLIFIVMNKVFSIRVNRKLDEKEEEQQARYNEIKRAQDATRELAERFKLVADSAHDALWDWAADTGTTFVSERFYKMLGYTKEEFYSEFDTLQEAIHPEDIQGADESFQAHLRGETEYFTSEYRLKTKNGGYKWVLSHGKAIMDSEGNVIRRAGSLTDITQRRLYEEEIKQLAYFDFLTGLPNRVMIFEEAEKLIVKSLKSNSALAFVFINFDNFKNINDAFGHEYGNGVLKIISARLSKIGNSLPNFFIGRLSGDEFVVLLHEYDDKEFVDGIVDKIFDVFKQIIQIENNSFFLSCSMGISTFPKDGDNVETLLKRADLAMYKAKDEGKDCYRYYDEAMGEKMAKRLTMESNLRGAVEKGELHLYYQPQIDAGTGTVTGFEALLRWFSPVHGFVSPATFIPIAEETGMIVPIGNWVMEKACEFAAKINKNCDKNSIKISINVSPKQLVQADFENKLTHAAKIHGTENNWIGIEITESSLLKASNEIIQKLDNLRKENFIILLDDFGTGYSSLNYLKNLPVDIIKIDKSFVDNIEKSDMERKLIISIVSLAKIIGMKVVAEGVETEGQLGILSQNNCDYIQGYVLSKPLPEEEALAFLQKKQVELPGL